MWIGGQEVIPAMLDTLQAYDVRVTFFVTGHWAKQYPDLVGFKWLRQGHEVAQPTGCGHEHPTQAL